MSCDIDSASLSILVDRDFLLLVVNRDFTNDKRTAGGLNFSLFSSSAVGGQFGCGSSLNFSMIAFRRIVAALLTMRFGS